MENTTVKVSGYRVGGHVVFVRYTVRKKCPTSFHNDVLSESKYPENCAQFFSSDFPDLTMPGYSHKAFYFECRLCHKVLNLSYRLKLYGWQFFSLWQSLNSK